MATKVESPENQRRTGVWVAVGLLALVFGFTIALTLPTYVDRANPFWFVGMLVIFGAALSLIAIVFGWLGVANREEAFSLPSGSIRTLLAIGVMVLFAVFGLEAMSVSKSSFVRKVAEQPIATAVAPSGGAALAAEIKRYEDDGMAVVVESVNGPTATLRLYRVEQTRPSETTDMQKQIVTALVTLLTSVVSFYFGSRSVEAARDKDRAKDKDTDTGALATIDAALAQLDKDIATGKERLSALQSETAAPGDEAALAAAMAVVVAEAPAIDADRVKLGAALADLQAGNGQRADVIEALAALRKRADAYMQRLSDAETLVAKG